MAANNTLPISVIAFDTEAEYDELVVNGVAYSGSRGPNGIVPTGAITWSSDPWLKQGACVGLGFGV